MPGQPAGHVRVPHLWDAAEDRKSETDMAACLRACLEEAPEDPALIAAALGDIARAHGTVQLAKETGITRDELYEALSRSGTDFQGGGESHACSRSDTRAEAAAPVERAKVRIAAARAASVVYSPRKRAAKDDSEHIFCVRSSVHHFRRAL